MIAGEPRAYVYILASRRNGTLYVGSTTDLSRRIWEHKQGLLPGFTRDYGVTMLVWYEGYDRLIDARHREYRIKKWSRAWKLRLIEEVNPAWRDLYFDLNN
jgi:putative endonuclease